MENCKSKMEVWMLLDLYTLDNYYYSVPCNKKPPSLNLIALTHSQLTVQYNAK